jgi:hypothetical protein
VETEESAVFGLLYSIPGCCVARDVQQHLCVEGGGRERERERERARERERESAREREIKRARERERERKREGERKKNEKETDLNYSHDTLPQNKKMCFVTVCVLNILPIYFFI